MPPNDASASSSHTPPPPASTMTNPAAPESAPPAAPSTKPKRKSKSGSRRKSRGDDSGRNDRPATAPAAAAAAAAAATSRLEPIFPDVSSTTPAAWADMGDKGDEITFDDFIGAPSAAATSSARGGRGGGRGGASTLTRGGRDAAAVKVLRELTAEEKQRVEDRNREKKERLKAKRQQVKEKRKAKPAEVIPKQAEVIPKDAPEASAPTPTPAPAVAPPAPAAAPAPPANDTTDASLAASTSALKLDDPPAAVIPPPTTTNNNTRPIRPAHDPKFTPRVGNFWMHDQRHSEAAGGNVGEGGFTGWRGRGGYRGGFRGFPRGGFRGRGGFMPFAPGAPHYQHRPTLSDGPRMAEMDKLELEAQQRGAPPAPGPVDPRGGAKWGHEGFEAQAAAENSFRNHRLMRGRGRGRGAFMMPRGGGAFARPFQPHLSATATLPTPEVSPDRAPKVISEKNVTQDAVDSLIDGHSGEVTVRLPGDASPVSVEARPPSQPMEPGFPSSFTPSNNPSPGPYVASDSGSISSGYNPARPVYAPPPPAPGAYGAPSFFPRNFGPPPPQSFTPEPAPVFLPPHHQQRGSFSGPAAFFAGPSFSPPGRTASPLNPYANNQAFFVPASAPPQQHQKMGSFSDISAAVAAAAPMSPTSDAADSIQDRALATPEGYVQPGFYAPAGYNPYAVPDGQTVFYPTQGYWPAPQTGYEEQYVYEGEFAAY